MTIEETIAELAHDYPNDFEFGKIVRPLVHVELSYSLPNDGDLGKQLRASL
jgi:hypothetical protein